MRGPVRGLLTACALLIAGPGMADDWDYELKPYLWSPSFSAGYTFGTNPPSSGEQSFWDIFEGAFLLQGEARKGDIAFLGEFNYLKLGDTVASSVPVLATDAGLDGYMISGALAKTVRRSDRSFLEMYGGARYWNLEMTAHNPAFGSAQSRKVWVDPIFGLRGEYQMSPKVLLNGSANIGGFGLGSDLQLDVQGAVSWEIGKASRFELGYRYLKVDFDDGDTVADLLITGPFVALAFQF